MSTETKTASPSELSLSAARLFARASLPARLMARYRPPICPFEEVIAAVPNRSRVLDVGCGNGLLLGLLADAGRIVEGVGFDSNRAAIAFARSMAETNGLADRLRFEALDAGAPWPAGPFDAVTIIDVLHHVPEPARPGVFASAAAALRPGGLLIYKDTPTARPGWRSPTGCMIWCWRGSGSDTSISIRPAGGQETPDFARCHE